MKLRQWLVVVVMIGALIASFFAGSLWQQQTQRDTPTVTLLDVASQTAARLGDLTLSDAIRVAPGDNLRQIVEEAPLGQIFIIGTGVHRQQSAVPRDGDVFIGEPGAILNGAALLTEFAQEGDLWVASGQGLEPWSSGECRANAPACTQAHNLFFDNVPLQPVAALADVERGKWFFDYDADLIYMADDPTGITVELTAVIGAFSGTARDVIIQNLTVEKYAGPGQVAAIRGNDSTNWTVMNNVVQLNSGVGIGVGNGSRVINNRVVNNGQMGVSGMGDNILLERNEIAFNNFSGFDPGWEAGGTKFVETDGLIARDNYVHSNDGPGLWTDGSNINSLYENNLVTNNTGAGIFHEISYAVTIRDNIVMYNNAYDSLFFTGAQILLSSSRDAVVTGNRVVVSDAGGNSIGIVQQSRGGGTFGEHLAIGNRIENNTIVFVGEEGQTGGAGLTDWAGSGNLFDNNTYYMVNPRTRQWGWNDADLNWDAFREHGMEQNGTLIRDVPLQLLVVPNWPPAPASPPPN